MKVALKGILSRLDGRSRRLHEGRRSFLPPAGLRFILYASARTGSTSLRLALDCYRGIYCGNEPFNADVPGNVRQRVTDLGSLKREVLRLWRHYNGFKHIYNPDRSRFGDPKMDDYLLTQAADRVVLLERKNVLQRIVSTRMSEQHRVWQVWGSAGRQKIATHPYEPLDKAAIGRELAVEREASEQVRRRLDASGRPYMSLWYEDIFGTETVDERVRALGEVIAFVTGQPFQEALLERESLRFLDGGETKVNSPATYELVPGIREIDDELGNERTGYLFR